jgi:hypothetical protein
VEVPHGSPEGAHSRRGRLRDRSCGFMGNVCPCNPDPVTAADGRRAPDLVAGSGKTGRDTRLTSTTSGFFCVAVAAFSQPEGCELS